MNLARLLRRTLAVAMVAGTAVVTGAPPATAVRTPVLTVERGKEAKATYGPIPGSYAGTPVAVPEPPDCGGGDSTTIDGNEVPVGTPGAFQAACDWVPIKIIPPPGLGATEDFLVTLTISWNPTDVVKDPSDGTVGDTPVDDIDVYLYDNFQVARREDPESSTFTNLGESNEFGGPERIRLFDPDLIDYNLVVVNVTGPNVDYTVEATMEISGFDYPFEDLGPTFSSRRSQAAKNLADDRSDNLVLPLDFSGGDGGSRGGGTSAADVSGFLQGGSRTLEQVPVLPDADFAGIATASDFEDKLAAPSPFGNRTRRIAAVKDAPVPLVVFWLVLVPIAILLALIIAAARRSRRTMRFA